jgi:hypothetical protein
MWLSLAVVAAATVFLVVGLVVVLVLVAIAHR